MERGKERKKAGAYERLFLIYLLSSIALIKLVRPKPGCRMETLALVVSLEIAVLMISVYAASLTSGPNFLISCTFPFVIRKETTCFQWILHQRLCAISQTFFFVSIFLQYIRPSLIWSDLKHRLSLLSVHNHYHHLLNPSLQ
jgi:hypothetical protein